MKSQKIKILWPRNALDTDQILLYLRTPNWHGFVAAFVFVDKLFSRVSIVIEDRYIWYKVCHQSVLTVNNWSSIFHFCPLVVKKSYSTNSLPIPRQIFETFTYHKQNLATKYFYSQLPKNAKIINVIGLYLYYMCNFFWYAGNNIIFLVSCYFKKWNIYIRTYTYYFNTYTFLIFLNVYMTFMGVL